MAKSKKLALSVRSKILMSAAAGFVCWSSANNATGATYVWDNSTSTWETPSAWSPMGPPASNDIATYDPTIPSTVVNNPVITGTDFSKQALLNNNPLGGNYTISGTGTYNVGSGGIIVRSYGTDMISGPAILNGSSGVALNIGNGALTLSGNSSVLNNGIIYINGGTLTLDNSTTNITRLGTTSSIVVGGGTFAVIGNIGGTNFSVPAIYVSTTYNDPGVDTYSVTQPAGAMSPTTVNFANTAALVANLTSTIYNFVGVGGTLGSSSGPQISFTTAPLLYAQGTIAAGLLKTNSQAGQAIATDSTGTGWATYNSSTGVAGTPAAGIQVMTPSAVAVTAANLQALTQNDVADFNPTANVTVSGTPSTSAGQGTPTAGQAAVVTGTLRITPASSGLTLDLATNTAILATEGLMLNGPNDFTISGGTIGGSATKYYYVTNPNTTLFTSSVLAGSGDGLGGTGQTSTGNPITYGGPGFLVFTGASYEVGITTNKRFNIDGGTVRGNATQLGGFSATGTSNQNAIALRGGVLEITGGADGTGSSADFQRTIVNVTTTGDINWSSSTGNDTLGGSGGFSAYGGAASVNLGGAASPTPLTWGLAASGFVQDGYSLIFGSAKSNARLDFLNPIALDGGTAGNYDARQIQVIKGAGGDSTNLAGIISGSASTDLIKSGTGTLQLTAGNTYKGRTLVEGGTVQANTPTLVASTSSATGTGNVIVASGGTLAGGTTAAPGQIAGTVTVSGTITAGTGATTSDTIGTLSSGAQTWIGGGTYAVKIGSTNGSSDELILSGLSNANTNSPFNIQVTGLPSSTFAAGNSYVIADNTTNNTTSAFNLTPGVLAVTTAGTATPYSFSLTETGDNNNGEELVLTEGSTAAPEPTSALLLGIVATPLLLGRRRRTLVDAAI